MPRALCSRVNDDADDERRDSVGERARSARVGGSGNGVPVHSSSNHANADGVRRGHVSVRVPGMHGDADVHGSR